ncbi:MAG: alpha/beta hydrolase [Candidatus Kapabacteria bacterium]|nr:alpha/beta hydrolase [Candidatus Kapabacteria bacterium]
MYNVEGKFATLSDSVKIHYKDVKPTKVVVGKHAPAIVFIHGFGCDMNAWSKQFNYFEGSNRAIYIDLPGYGKSSKLYIDYSLDLFADAVNAVLTEAHISGAILVGHSLGTPVARQVVFRYPKLASKIVDVDGVYCFYPADAEMTEAYRSFAESFNTDNIKQMIEAFVGSLFTEHSPQSVRDYAGKIMPQTPKYVAYSTMKNLIDEKYWTNEIINIPALVYASKNSQIPPNYRDIMGKHYSNMQYFELLNIGHFIMMEQAEEFNSKLKNFIK